MYFNTISDFLQMGGYASYVWPAYGIVAIVLLGNIVAAMRQRKKVWRQLQTTNTIKQPEFTTLSAVE